MHIPKYKYNQHGNFEDLELNGIGEGTAKMLELIIGKGIDGAICFLSDVLDKAFKIAQMDDLAQRGRIRLCEESYEGCDQENLMFGNYDWASFVRAYEGGN